jgi:hypothetical protein
MESMDGLQGTNIGSFESTPKGGLNTNPNEVATHNENKQFEDTLEFLRKDNSDFAAVLERISSEEKRSLDYTMNIYGKDWNYLRFLDENEMIQVKNLFDRYINEGDKKKKEELAKKFVLSISG